MSIIGGLTTATRAFGELFGGAKDALGDIQKNMASLLPAMPGLPVGKFLDLSIGVDFHPIIFPWVLPICPVPHVGIVFDLTAAIMGVIAPAIPSPDNEVLAVVCNLAKGMAPSVKVHGKWIAQAGISIVPLPGLVVHLLPTVGATAESEMWMGSSIVLADGGPCSTQFHPALSCNLVGVPPPPRKGKTFKKRGCLMAPTALLSIITSSGNPVLVGGPPTIDLFQLAMKLGLKGLSKIPAVQKLQNKLGDLWSKTPMGKLQKKLQELWEKTPLGKIQALEKRCHLGEPVDAASGRVYHTNTDFELAGPIPLVWSRTYYSDVAVNGPLGYNWHHSYNVGIRDLDGDGFVYRHPDGRESGLLPLLPDESYFDRKEQLLWSRDERGYVLRDASKLYYRFDNRENRWGYCPVSDISTADGSTIRFRYTATGDLKEITDSCGRVLAVENDGEGRVTSVSTYFDNRWVDFVRYRYDGDGNLVETFDASDVRKSFEYRGHLLVKLTNPSGMSFHWEYEGNGNNARCIHTWGDGGILEYFFDYLPEHTRARNGEGAVTEYYYKPDKLIDKIVDANGGITRQFYNEYEELIRIVDAEGFIQKSKYDDWGNLVQKRDRNSELLLLAYDRHQNLTRVKTPGGRVLKWEYDAYDRITQRTLPSGETLSYAYEGRKPQSITNSQKRRYDFAFNDRMELERLTYPNGISRKWQYDGLGRVTESRDVKGNITRYWYDYMSRVVRLAEPDGNEHDFRYDASGNLIYASDQLREVEFGYGALGVLTRRKQGNRTLRFGYNSELQLTSISNEKQECYRFGLDGLGQVTEETGFDGITRRYDRDGLGRVRRVERPADRWTEFVYDGIGNVIKEEQYDGKVTLYAYDSDSLLKKAHNDDCKVEFRRDKAGRIIEEKQNGYTVSRTFDKQGNCVRTSSSLGADIQSTHTGDGLLSGMSAGESKEWQASWERDETGLEIHRSINSGLEIRTWRDNFGREIKKHISPKGSITTGSYSYQWGMSNRLLSKANDLTGLIATFEYNEFDDLNSATYRQGSEVETIYKVPDRIGAVYRQWDRRDREYGEGGKLLEDPECFYHYDAEGNLIFKEYRKAQPEGTIYIDKKQRAKEMGIAYRGSGMGWRYDWLSNGMLRKVTRPDGAEVIFTYDALGRRLSKYYMGTVTRWVWDGNTLLHECATKLKNTGHPLPPVQPDDENLITWVFENGTFVPAAKITRNEQFSIVTDYLGTPVQMYDSRGTKTWDCELDVYGKVRTFEGSSLSGCPFRQLGQYEDEETGLYYNRFRYYSPEIGGYLSQDPIGLAGNNPTLYGYVHDANCMVDIFGLECWRTAKKNYWKTKYADEMLNPTGKYSPNNLALMKRGNAPKIKVEVSDALGNRNIVDVPIELHHTSLPQRLGSPKANEAWNLTEATPWGHASMDSYRNLGDDFNLERIINGTNSW